MADGRIDATLGNFTMGAQETPHSYLVSARHYQLAAGILADHLPGLLPVFIQLVGQSLECALKAYVLHHGKRTTKTGKNHNLKYWWNRCNRLNLCIGEFPEWAQKVNAAYDGPYLSRYYKSNTGYVSSPTEIVLQGLEGVITRVESKSK